MIQMPKGLFYYQEEAVKYIEKKKGRVLLADEPGLGKTIMALAWLSMHPEARPVIIVCPAVVKINWRREANKWIKGESVALLTGRTPDPKVIKDKKIIIVNYDILANFKKVRVPGGTRKWRDKWQMAGNSWVQELLKIKPKAIVVDEVHKIKDNSRQQTKAVTTLVKKSKVKHLIMMTGTPILNNPVEIYNTLKLLNPKVVPPFEWYAQRYCKPKRTCWGWEYTGGSNTKELNNKLKSLFMLRRKKKKVLDLPDKCISHIKIPISNREDYTKAEDQFFNFVKDYYGSGAVRKAAKGGTLVKITYLRQLVANGKIDSGIEWIRDFLETTNEKLVVFAIHRNVVDNIVNAFPEISVSITGSTSMKNRDEAVQRFQNDDTVKLFVGNIKAAGVGLTLTASRTVAFLELPWTPSELEQAMDRTHRVGQNKEVHVNYLIAENTIEGKLLTVINKKAKIINAVVDGEKVTNKSIFKELLHLYEQEDRNDRKDNKLRGIGTKAKMGTRALRRNTKARQDIKQKAKQVQL